MVDYREKTSIVCEMVHFLATDGLCLFLYPLYNKLRAVVIRKSLLEWLPMPDCTAHSELRYAIRRLFKNATDAILEADHSYVTTMSLVDQLAEEDDSWLSSIPLEVIHNHILPYIGSMEVYALSSCHDPMSTLSGILFVPNVN